MRKLFLLVASALAWSATSMADELVTEQPAGTLRTFHGYSMSTYPMYIEITEATDGVARDVVFADNGTDVWFKDPLTHAAAGTWIKGTLHDGIITVETPQIMDHTENNGEVNDWYVQRLKKVTVTTDSGERTEWVPDTEKTSITYSYNGDEIVQIPEDEEIMLGMTLDGKFMHYGERDVVYTKFDGQTTKFPEGSEPERWSMIYNEDKFANQANVLIDGDQIYISGFWVDFPNACIKGSVQDNKVIIPSRQYLGLLRGAGVPRYMYFMSAERADSQFASVFISSGDDMEFAYDKEARTLTPLFGENIVPVVRYGKTAGVFDDSTNANFPTMRMKGIDHIAPLPDITLTPGGTFVENEYGWGSIEFTFRALDSEMNALDPHLMTYSIWQDDQILVIDKEDALIPEAYEGIDEPITEIPYLFSNDYGIDSRGSLAMRRVDFFRIGFKEVGVQGFYYDDLSGERLATRITYINPETQEIRYAEDPNASGVKDVTSESAKAVETVRYDVNGNRVADTFKGIVVERTIYSDGTVKTSKKVMR